MTRPQAPINRFFVSSDYSLYYRLAKQFDWQNQVVADYAVMMVLSGRLDCFINDEHTQLAESQSLIIEPNVSINASGKQVEFLFLTLAPSLVIEHAIAMRLIAPQSTVRFTPHPIESDDKLNDLFENFAGEVVDEKPGKDIVMRALAEQAL